MAIIVSFPGHALVQQPGASADELVAFTTVVADILRGTLKLPNPDLRVLLSAS